MIKRTDSIYPANIARNGLLWLFFALSFIVSVNAQAFPKVQVNEYSSTSLQIEYPKNEYFKAGDNFTLYFHLYDANSTPIYPVSSANVNCSMHIYNGSGNAIVETNLTYEVNSYDVKYVATPSLFKNEDLYPYILWCHSVRGDGFVNAEFTTTIDGNRSNGLWELPVAIMLASYFIVFMFIGVNWAFQLFGKNGRDKDSIIKIIICWIVLWLLLGLLQLSILVATNNSAPASVVTVLTMLYTVTVWIDVLVTIVVALIFLVNLLMYLSSSYQKKGGGG